MNARETTIPTTATAAAPTAPFEGIWPALLTPLTERLDIDHGHFAEHAQRLLARGCVGLTPFGTTGEGPSFSMRERLEAIDALVARGVPAERLLVSTSCAALPEVIELTRHAVAIGAHGALVMPPFFLKNVPDQGVIDAYRTVIDGVADARLRVYLYHIPQVSGVALSHHVIRTLSELYPDTIVGLKDSGCQREPSVERAHAFMSKVMVYVGNEPDLQTMGRLGSRGAVSGLANMVPRLVHRLVRAFDAPDAPVDHARVVELLAILGGYGLTAALKGIMAWLDDDPRWLRVRAPLVPLTADEYARLSAQLRDWGLDPARD